MPYPFSTPASIAYYEANAQVFFDGTVDLDLSPLQLARRIGTEKAYGVAKNGIVVVERDGEEDQIAFNNDELTRLAGCVLTHNHPSRRSFSLADIQIATQYQFDEIRSVTRSHVLRARPPKEGWLHGKRKFIR
jgi:hypothetical protein